LSRGFCGGSKIAKKAKIKKIVGTLSSSLIRSQPFFYSSWAFMVYCKISLDMNRRALYLLLEEGWEIDQITAVSGVHSTSIERWRRSYETHGIVNPPTPLRGRRQLLNSNITEELHEMIIESPSLLLDEVGPGHGRLQDLRFTLKRLKRIQVAAKQDDAYRAD
jgi:transposase